MPHSRCSYCRCHEWEWLEDYEHNLVTCDELEHTVKQQARDLRSLRKAKSRLRAKVDDLASECSTQSSDILYWMKSESDLRRKSRDEIGVAEAANRALRNEVKNRSAAMEKALKTNADLQLTLDKARITLSDWTSERSQTQDEMTALQTELEEFRNEHELLQEDLNMLRIESKATKEIEKRLRRRLIGASESIRRYQSRFAEQRAFNLALVESVATLEETEAQLRLIVGSCWQHRFRGWIASIWRFLMSSNQLALVRKSPLWLKQRLGTVGWLGLNFWEQTRLNPEIFTKIP